MKLGKILILLFVLIILGGVLYISTTDVQTEQKTVTKTISNERFYKNN